MSVKFAQNDFTRKIKDFNTFTRLLRFCQNDEISPNLVTLSTMDGTTSKTPFIRLNLGVNASGKKAFPSKMDRMEQKDLYVLLLRRNRLRGEYILK